eukprot:8348979-Pyramimonas_sp.AAC.1
MKHMRGFRKRSARAPSQRQTGRSLGAACRTSASAGQCRQRKRPRNQCRGSGRRSSLPRKTQDDG